MQGLLQHDLVLNLPEHGMHLLFSPVTQRLRLIEVYDLSRMQVWLPRFRPACISSAGAAPLSPTRGSRSPSEAGAHRAAGQPSLCTPGLTRAGAQVRCGTSVVGGASKPATVARVYDLCGPTYPGQLDAAAHAYVVQYPGVLFLFPTPAGRDSPQEMPPEAPGAGRATADRICIFAGSAGAQSVLACLLGLLGGMLSAGRICRCHHRRALSCHRLHGWGSCATCVLLVRGGS